MARRSNVVSTSDVVAQIRKKLGHLTLEWKPTAYLDMGSEEVNGVFGHRDYGIPFGAMVEISGLESQGKSAVAYTLIALAQAAGAAATLVDFENSYESIWGEKRGIVNDSLVVLKPVVGKFGNEKKERLITAEELCEEAEACVTTFANHSEKQILVLDSIPSMLLKAEEEAGLTGHNMRTNQELPMFMSRLLRRWVGVAQVHSVLVILINQLRQSPAARFTDPWYTPGGNAVRFYSGARLRVLRTKGGKIQQGGRTIGIQGTITARKNKIGGVEGSKIGFKLYFDSGLEFTDAKDIKREDEEKDDE